MTDESSSALLPPPGPVSEYKFRHQYNPPAVFLHCPWFFLGVSAAGVGCQGAVTNYALWSWEAGRQETCDIA